MRKPLDPPPPIEHAKWAVELVRMWAADGRQHVSIRWDYFEDPEVWGVALVDLARHLARAYAQGSNCDPAAVMHAIRDAFDAEWDRPTDLGRGALRDTDE